MLCGLYIIFITCSIQSVALKVITTGFFLFLIGGRLLAQEGMGAISGRVTDEENTPIAFANVVVRDTSGELVAGTTSDTSGAFHLHLDRTGSFVLEVRFMGYRTQRKHVTIEKGSALDVGTSILSPDHKMLSEVKVVKHKPWIEQKIDRLVFHIENSVAAAGGDALDALKVTPGVAVQNDRIGLIGKGGVRLMLNGRILRLSDEDLTNFLQSISADDIQRIEVIITPPARYEAEGDSGLIDIVLKKARADSWSHSLRARYIQTTYPAYGIGNTFNYSKNKLRLSVGLNAKKGYEARFYGGRVTYPDRLWCLKSDMKLRRDYLSGRMGLDYNVSKKAVIGLQYLRDESRPDMDDYTNINTFNRNSSPRSRTLSVGANGVKDHNHALNVHYIQQLDSTGKKLSMDWDYFTYRETQDRHFNSRSLLSDNTQTDFSAVRNLGEQNVENYSAELDVAYPIKWAELNYGAKVSFTQTRNDVQYFDQTSGTPVLDPLQSNVFTYTENTQAIYVEMTRSWGEKWQAKWGLRLENTETKGVSQARATKRHDSQLFPTAYLLYHLNDSSTLNLNYSRRIKRPSFWALNPFRFYLNSATYTEGSPFLKPAFSDRIELRHSYSDKLISIFSFGKVSDGFGQVPVVHAASSQQVYVQKNYHTTCDYSLSEIIMLSPFSWWQSRNYGQVSYSKSQLEKNSGVNALMQNGFAGYISTYNALVIDQKKELKGEVDFWYQSLVKRELFQSGAAYSLNVGIKMSLSDRLQASLMVYDVFKTSIGKSTTFTGGIRQVYNSDRDARFLRLALKYRLGNDKISVSEHKVKNKAERSRVH